MYCENCGKEIADTVPVCPHCGQATGASSAPGPAPAATGPGRGAARLVSEQSSSLLSRAEKAVYFRLARGFSWVLLIVITLGLIVNVILIVPEISQAVGPSISVGPQDLDRAMSSPSSLQSGSDQGEASLNPAEMAQLDEVAYEIVKLLPAARNNANVDYWRAQIRGLAANLSNERKEQLAILQELRDDLREVPESQRQQAINTYFNLKARVIQEAQNKKQAAQQKLVFSGASLVSGIVLLTLVTMILVLLSVERNTRSSRA
jgi:zinc-ribbon domain